MPRLCTHPGLETSSEVVFQSLARGRAAGTGELSVLAEEVGPVVQTLDEHGLHVTAVHSHMVDESPTMYWVHWYATGDPRAMARGFASALARTNSVQRSQAESQ